MQAAVERLHAGAGQGLGVHRVAGRARVGGRLVAWSAVVKVLPPSPGGPVTGWWHPDREVLAYRSRLLRELPGGLVAPRCLFVHEDAVGRRHLWLEDLGRSDDRWSLETYALAARRLGRLNGAYISAIPDHAWLSRDWLRAWLAETAEAVAALAEHGDHPLVRRVYPPDLAVAIARLWSEREAWLAALDRLPQTLCHHDAFRRNLIAAGDRIAAVDWAFAGQGPIGAELAPLVCATLGFRELPLAARAELERATLTAYRTGLREAGWRGADEEVWFGYAATSALRYGPGTVRLVLPVLLDPARRDEVAALLGIPFEAIVEHWAAVIRDHVGRAPRP